MTDGSTLRTRKDAAHSMIENEPGAIADTAIARLMDSAERDGDVAVAERATRIALFNMLDFTRSR
jgi:hypothetical protein